MNTIESLLEKLTKKDWYTNSYIKGVSFLKTTLKTTRAPLMYESRIIIVGRGKKIWYINSEVFHYNADNYLILSLPMSFECEAGEDVLALIIDIDLKILSEVISNFSENEKICWDINKVVNAIPMKPNLQKSVIRMLEIANSEEESRILGESILKEILYRILKDRQWWDLFALYQKDSKFARFAQLIRKINNNLSSQYSLKELASEMVMSETSLYRYFKKLTSQAPLQYIKNIRLQKAREYILKNDLSLYEVSKKIGYNSISQFSREYSRFFWFTPKQTKN